MAIQVATRRPWLAPLIVEPLNRLRESGGLPSDTRLAMPYRYLLLVPAPLSHDGPAFPLPSTAHTIRHAAFDRSGGEPLPAWIDMLPDQLVVYATMGTVSNQVPGILEAVVEELRDEPITLIVSTGPNQDPADPGPQPSNVHIERYVPQSLLFPHRNLVVIHGGSGTVLTALDYGPPRVNVPVAADQPDNARRCEQMGSDGHPAGRSHPGGLPHRSAGRVGGSQVPTEC